MSCAACVARVERAVAGVPGVDEVAVSLLTNSMGVGGVASPDDVISAVRSAGYGASLKGGEHPSPAVASATASTGELADTETPRLLRRLFVSLIFLMMLMYVSMGHMMWGWPLPSLFDGNHVAAGLLQLLLTVVIMIINSRFFTSGVTALWRRSPNMDTLVALGAAAAFAYSTVALFAMTAAQVTGGEAAASRYMDELYFESAAMILTLITLGKTLEAHSKGKTTDALRGLLSLAPKTANVIRDGAEVTVRASEVRVGDVFVVRPGEQIPVDGEITDGVTAVDESSLTGESIPADKTAGDRVFSGTLNQSGFITCTATRVGADTTLSQIIKMVEDAAATKAPIAKLADRVAGVFVPAVIAAAAVTLTVWLICGATVGYALARAISVLVISCPCALGLATPVAIMVGSGVGAKNGILYKTAASLEAMGRVQIAALDKTGTITAGAPRVTDIIPAEGTAKDDLLAAAYALEVKSEHPLARAIITYAEENGLPEPPAVTDFRALPGNGLSAVLRDGAPVVGGSAKFIAVEHSVPEGLHAAAAALAEKGKTPLFFARGEECLGVIAVADVIKPDSARAIGELSQMGIRTVMLTGDNERTARAIADAAGVDDVIAGVLPDGKEAVIRELKREGKTVMVGDGINDAPALTSADIGIAVGAGADVAIDAAEVVLMKSSLADVPAAIRLGRATLRNIRENLFWAFIYNIIGIPLAAGVFIPLFGWRLDPMYGALAMSLSSFCVVTNALRLNLTRIYPGQQAKKSNKKEKNKMKTTLKIKGMMCAHCEARVKAALEAVPGVTGVQVSHKRGAAVVDGDADRETLTAAVKSAGYEVVG